MEIKLTADFHTHTVYSDGVGTITQNVEAARAMGLNTIGITDHGFFHVAHGIKRRQVAAQRAEIDGLRAKYPDMQILLGVEANLINLKGELDLGHDDIALFDYIIFGVHKFACSIWHPSSVWFALMNYCCHSERRRQKVTDSYISAIKNYPVKIVVHPNYAARVDVARLASAASQKGVWVELNGKRINMGEEDAQALKNSGVSLVIGSDAHSPGRVGECSIPADFIQKYDIPLSQIVNINTEEKI